MSPPSGGDLLMHMSTAEAAFKIQPTFYTRAADWSTEQQYLIRPSDWLEAPTVASMFVCFFFPSGYYWLYLHNQQVCVHTLH